MSTAHDAAASPPPTDPTERTTSVARSLEQVDGAPDADTPSPLRASDAERTETIERLHQALGAGRLDLAETDERVAAAYAARHRHELTALLSDLPTTDTTFGAAPSWAALWVLAVWRVRTFLLPGGEVSLRPTRAQLRTAAVFTALGAGWFVVCALLGAVAVGA